MTLINTHGDLNNFDRVNLYAYQAAESSDEGRHREAIARLEMLEEVVEEWLDDERSALQQ